MYKFKEFTDDDWRRYDQLILYQKLQNILGDLGKDTWQNYLWANLTPEARMGPLRKFTVDFDLDNQKIDVKTKATDNDGLPLYEWKLDSSLGEIQHIKRIPLVDPKAIAAEDAQRAEAHRIADLPGSATHVNEVSDATVTTTSSVAPTTTAPTTAPAPQPVAAPATVTEAPVAESATDKAVVIEHVSPIEGPIDPDFDNLENQRDLAFKIVYFFIMFIIATFGLLYAYFRMDQKEQEKINREKRAKGTFFGEIDNKTFFDFLSGQVDQENYQVNPHARTGI